MVLVTQLQRATMYFLLYIKPPEINHQIPLKFNKNVSFVKHLHRSVVVYAERFFIAVQSIKELIGIWSISFSVREGWALRMQRLIQMLTLPIQLIVIISFLFMVALIQKILKCNHKIVKLRNKWSITLFKPFYAF